MIASFYFLLGIVKLAFGSKDTVVCPGFRDTMQKTDT